MTCIIIEDEIPAQKILKSFIAKIPSLKLLGTFKAAIEANSFLNTASADIVFLDINLPDMSGLDFIKTIKSYFTFTNCIFCFHHKFRNHP